MPMATIMAITLMGIIKHPYGYKIMASTLIMSMCEALRITRMYGSVNG